MVQLRTEIQKKVAEHSVSKIVGQPTMQAIDLLEEELIAVAASIATSLGGGDNGHVGMLMENADYMNEFTVAAPGFVPPANPGVYPAGPFAAGTRAQREAQHEKEVEVYQTYLGVGDGLKDLVRAAVDEDYVIELKAERVGYLRVTATQMIAHLRSRWGTADFVDKCALINELNTPWNAAEIPTIYFNRVEKAIKQLARVNVVWLTEACVNSVLKAFKDTGDYDAAVREWEAKAEADKTWTNVKTMITSEYSKYQRQHSTTAKSLGYGSANALEDYAAITEEVVAALTEDHARDMKAQMQRMEALAKAMTEVMANVKAQLPTTAGGTAGSAGSATGTTQKKTERQKKHDEYREKLKTAIACTHCDRKHPNRRDDLCWELEANAATRPANWKSVKSN